MQKYILFGFENGNSSGGMNDVVLKFDTYDEVDEYYSGEDFDELNTYQLLNTSTFEYEEMCQPHQHGIHNKLVVRKEREELFREWIIAAMDGLGQS